jgi:vesicle coat complex subunit
MDKLDWGSMKKEEVTSNIAEQKHTINCGVSSTNHSYFEKKGEINELRRILRALNDQQSLSDPEELREGLKKVIAVMTMGIDVRELFQEVIMLSYTR